jgi:hypothetical protein
MKQFFSPMIYIIIALLLLLHPSLTLAQDADPTVQGPIIQATFVPDETEDNGGLEFKLPPLDDGYAWMYGVFIAQLVVIVVLVFMLRGSVPLALVNALLGVGKGVTRALPGKQDDRVYDWFEGMVRPSLDPNRWPLLIRDLVTESVITQMLADEVVSSIAAQNLNPYQAYEQAAAMAGYLRSRTKPVSSPVKEGAGAQAVTPEGFPGAAG